MSINGVWLAELEWLDRCPDTEPDKIRPTSITVDLSHRCNFRCPVCIENEGMCYSRRTDIFAPTACRLISQFADIGGKEVLFYGGEPTIHREFNRIVIHASARMELIRIITNGSFLFLPKITKALWIAAEEAKVIVRVSLNAGSAQTHEKLHGVRGYFGRVVEGMKTLTSEGSSIPLHRPTGSRVKLEVSYLLEEANANEILQAYDIAAEVGAMDFWIRPKTGVHGIGLVPLSPTARQVVEEAVSCLGKFDTATPAEKKRLHTQPAPKLHVAPWYLEFLKTNRPPDTDKPYRGCYYCAAARLVITPPEPGVVWSCTYFRAHPRFHIANLSEVPFGSDKFERCRIAAIQRIDPTLDCAGVICNRNEANKAMWENLKAKSVFSNAHTKKTVTLSKLQPARGMD